MRSRPPEPRGHHPRVDGRPAERPSASASAQYDAVRREPRNSSAWVSIPKIRGQPARLKGAQVFGSSPYDVPLGTGVMVAPGGVWNSEAGGDAENLVISKLVESEATLT